MEATQDNRPSIQNYPDKEPVTICDRLAMPIEDRILTLRGKQVMIDGDLSELYGVETRHLNEQVRRDAYAFVDRLIRKAKKRTVVVDSYVDDSVQVQLSKREPGVALHSCNNAHDRSLIIDEEVFHIAIRSKTSAINCSRSQN